MSNFKVAILSSANRKKNEMRKTGGGPAPPQYTASEELALANNEGRPIMEGIEGGIKSDPCASSSQHHLYVQGMYGAFGVKNSMPVLCGFEM